MEALIGAIYLDGGFTNAKEFIHRFILNDIEHKQLFYDSKTILQEMIQSRQTGVLSYEIIKEEGLITINPLRSGRSWERKRSAGAWDAQKRRRNR